MSKDSRPNYRDLYKRKGKKLSSDEEESKLTTKEMLSTSLSHLKTKTTLPPILQEKILKLRISLPSSDPEPDKMSYSYKSDKQWVQLMVLSFGLLYQRVTGSAIPSTHFLFDQFLLSHPEITDLSEKNFEEILKTLQSQGLLYQSTPELLFEPLEKSLDFNSIFSLMQPAKNSLEITRIKANFPSWSDQKLDSLIASLVEHDLAILDNDVLWFPQLESS